MSRSLPHGVLDRRSFLTALSGLGGAAALGAAFPAIGRASSHHAARVVADQHDWRTQIGLQLFTVRDQTARDYPGTLLRVGEMGYREVQTTGSYGEHTAARIHQYLERAGLSAPTTHVNPPMDDDFERTLEGYQLIGHRYTTINTRGPRGGAPRVQGAGLQAGGQSGAPASAPARRAPAPAPTLGDVKRMAEQLNVAGETTRKYGIKVIYHNHTNEFAPLADASLRPYDVLLAETDPALVAMELDIGWARAAGQDILAMFRANPGRYEVWHVKDVADLAALDALETQAERQRAARIVPIGDGEIDYRPIFAAAELAGMKHYYIEQDSAPQSGDSLAEAARSYQALMRALS